MYIEQTDEKTVELEAVIEQSVDSEPDSSKNLADENSERSENLSDKSFEHSENVVDSEKSEENLDDDLLHAEKSDDLIDDSDDDFDYSSESMITTVDNPFDPFEDFDQWFLFDEEKGYHTCSYLGRIVKINDEMSEQAVAKEIDRAINEILAHDFLRIYKKINKRIPDSDTSTDPPADSPLEQSDSDTNGQTFQNSKPDSVYSGGETRAATPEGG